MKKTLSVLLVNLFVGFGVMAQTPANPPVRVLTPAEQRQKEKNDREIQRERQIRAEWLQKQREYEAKQAEKERLRAAKKAGRPIEPPTEVAKPAATVPVKPGEPAVINQPTTAVPPAAEPARREKKEKRKKEVKEAVSKPEPTPVVEPVATPTAETPAPVKEARPERVRVKREKKNRPVDSVAVASVAGREEMVSICSILSCWIL
jgi:hypothetical protein